MINEDLFPQGSLRPYVPLTEAEHVERDNHIRRLEHELRVARRDLKEAQDAIRTHRDTRGDDRCYQDDAALYAVLPEGDTRPERETLVTIENCQRYIACRQGGREYVSPQRRIEELEAEGEKLRAVLRHCEEGGWQLKVSPCDSVTGGWWARVTFATTTVGGEPGGTPWDAVLSLAEKLKEATP